MPLIPYQNRGWQLLLHESRPVDFDRSRMGLVSCETWRNREFHIMNSDALDFYLANPDRIPEACRGRRTVFLGTHYLNRASRPEARCLINYPGDPNSWSWSTHHLDDLIREDVLIAVVEDIQSLS